MDTKKTAEQFLDMVKKIWGDDIVSCILYGSAAKGTYKKGVSDINLIFIIEKLDYSKIFKTGKLSKIAYKNRIKPFFFTKDFLQSSCDVFPVEWEDIRENHIIVYGIDLTENIKTKEEEIRLEVERQIKQEFINFQQSLIFEKDKSFVIADSIKNIKFLRKYIELTVKNKIELPEYFSIVEKTDKIGKKQISDICEQHLKFLENLIRIINKEKEEG